MIDRGTMKKYFTVYENEQALESFKTKNKAIETIEALKEFNKKMGIEPIYYEIKEEYIKTFFINDN